MHGTSSICGMDSRHQHVTSTDCLFNIFVSRTRARVVFVQSRFVSHN